MDGTRASIVVLLALVVLNVSWTAAVDHRSSAIEDRLDDVEDDQELIATFAGANGSVPDGYEAEVSLYAYSNARGEAVVVPTKVTAVPADGLYLNVGAVAHTATFQQSAKTALTVANGSDSEPGRRGAVVSLSTPEAWERVGGGSAALPMAIAFAATNPCTSVNESVAATGGMAADGTVAEVEYVREKAVAARERNVSVLVVPAGQDVSVAGIRVVPVSRFEEALAYAVDRRTSCAEG